MDRETRLSLMPPVKNWRERLQDWLRDDGLYAVFSRTVIYSTSGIVSFMLGGFIAYAYVKIEHPPIAPIKQLSKIIDGHSTEPMRDTHLRFDLPPPSGKAIFR